jgi:hypothetical protein
MPVIIPRLADLERAACHACWEGLGGATEAAVLPYLVSQYSKSATSSRWTAARLVKPRLHSHSLLSYVLNKAHIPSTLEVRISPGRAIAQAVSRRLQPRRPGFKPGSGHVGFCDGQKWRWGRFSPRTSVSPANLHSICFSIIIFIITRGWHNRPGVTAVTIASQTK